MNETAFDTFEELFDGSILSVGPMANLSDTNETTGIPTRSQLNGQEITTVALTAVIGCAGVVLNVWVLAVVYYGNLVKKDYRMIYYIFITVGDLMFAIHTVNIPFTIVFRDAWFFREFFVCFNLQLVLGVVPYQWSAVCIVFLIVDLTWSLKFPFTGDDRKRLFSKVACVLTFVLGIIFATVPFTTMWLNAHAKLPFCSIANVYGSEWKRYQMVVTTNMSLMFLMMLVSSCYLIYVIYRQQNIYKPRTVRHDSGDVAQSPIRPSSPHPARANRIKPSSEEHITVISVDVDVDGTDNLAFEEDVKITSKSNGDMVATAKEKQVKTKELTAMETKRKHFIKACRTVGMFMVVYFLCCGPYIALMAYGVGCENCDKETTEQRAIRALVSVSVYLLPVLDPILYTQRFDLFKVSAYSMLRACSK